MRAMMKSLALLIAGGVVLALSAVPVRATPVPPVWTYFATSCNGCSHQIPPTEFYSPPRAFATFSSPDSSGTYSFYSSGTYPGPPFEVTGNDNFAFYWGNDPAFFAPAQITDPCPGSSLTGCGWTVTWAQGATGLSINVRFGNEFTGFQVDDTMVSISSDLIAPHCGDGSGPSECSFTGYWTTSSVPLVEPSSLVGLASAILGFFLMMLVRSSGKSRPVGPDLVGAGALSAGKSG